MPKPAIKAGINILVNVLVTANSLYFAGHAYHIGGSEFNAANRRF
jgi:hypothetical protein